LPTKFYNFVLIFNLNIRKGEEVEVKVKALIFDMDGTLLALPVNYSLLKIRLSKELGRHVTSIFGTLVGLLREGNIEMYRRVLSILDEEELRAVENVRIFPDTIGVLRHFDRKGAKLALVTLQGRKVVRRILSMSQLGEFFGEENVVTREYSIFREVQLQRVLEMLEVEPSEAVFVGDRENDARAGREIGCRVFIIRRSESREEEVSAPVIRSLEELKTLVSV